jgi:hypothetical protein
MMSKKLKNQPKRFLTQECGCPEGDGHDCTRLQKALRAIGRFYMFQVYYPIESFFRRLHERIGRSLAWAKLTYLNYDFDSSYLYEVMEFKLKRIYECLKNGHAIQRKEDMAALRELIKICGRLRNYDDYEDPYREAHDKKWGKMPRWGSEPVKNDKGEVTSYKMIFKDRPKANTPKKKEQERKEFRDIWEKAEQDYCKDIDRMAEILKKHGKTWWD